jgi:hypothetical protein
LVDIQDGTIFQKKFKKSLTTFPWRTEMRTGVGLGCGWRSFFDLFLNLHIWGWLYFMDRYLSQECTAKGNLQKSFIDFLWRTEVWTGVLASAQMLGISFQMFEPPYLEEK